MDINYNGYYISRIPVEYIDRMASGSVKSFYYTLTKFFDNGYFVKGTSQDSNFDFNSKAQEVLSKYTNKKTNVIFTVGKYKKDLHQLFLYSKVLSTERIDIYTMSSEKVLLNENLEEYDFRE